MHEVHHPQWSSRSVTLICGPPGSGKSTLARQLHPDVVELEDFDHLGDYRQALKLFGRRCYRIGRSPSINIAVIRGAPTVAEREHHENLCRPARTIVLLTPADVCRQRIEARDVIRPGSLEAVGEWWSAWRAENPPPEQRSARWA
jgi:MoxR-like ATPase